MSGKKTLWGALVAAVVLALAVLAAPTHANAALPSAPPTSAAQASKAETSKVFVVHGIPGQPVDVYVNGGKVLSNFQPTTIAGPLELAGGVYDIVLTKPGAPVTRPIVRADDVNVPGAANLSLVAHVSPSAQPTLTAFANDVSKVPAGKARLTVRHTAAAPAVDVRASGQPLFANLTNPNEAKAEVNAGTVSADVVLAGTQTVVLGPTDLNLAEGTATIVYAIGSAEARSLALVVQVLSGLDSPPQGVPSGDGGLADPSVPLWVPLLAAAGALLLTLGRMEATRSARRAMVRR